MGSSSGLSGTSQTRSSATSLPPSPQVERRRKGMRRGRGRGSLYICLSFCDVIVYIDALICSLSDHPIMMLCCSLVIAAISTHSDIPLCSARHSRHNLLCTALHPIQPHHIAAHHNHHIPYHLITSHHIPFLLFSLPQVMQLRLGYLQFSPPCPPPSGPGRHVVQPQPQRAS